MKRIAAFVFAFLAVWYLQASDADAQFRRECRYGFCTGGGGPTGTPISNACVSTPGTTITFTAQGTGGTNPNRISVVSINWSSAGSSGLTAVTIGGISMTRAVRATASSIGNNSEIWFVANPTGTSSNIVLTASVALTGATIEVYSLIGYRTVIATTTGTTSISQTYNNKQLAIGAGSRAINVSTSLSNMNTDFSAACGLGLWGVHTSQALHGNGTLTSSINPTSNNPEIALAVWSTDPPPNCPVVANLTGLIGSWDASVFSSLTISAGKITAAADQSGAGHTMAGPSGPNYNATGFNGLPAFDWGASGTNGLSVSSFPFGTGNTLTFYTVISMNNSTGSFGRIISYFAGGSNDADNNASFLVARNAGSNALVLYRNASTASTASLAFIPHILIATINSSGVMTIYVDNVAVTGNTLNAAFGATGTLALGIAAFSNTSNWIGPMGEAGLTNTFTNSTNAGLLYTCLKSKWGL